MPIFVPALLDQAVEIEFPAEIADDIAVLFGRGTSDTGETRRRFVVSPTGEGRFGLTGDGVSFADLKRDDLLAYLMDNVTRSLVERLCSGVALHAGLVELDGCQLLLPGPTGSGKSSLVAWLVAQGFSYASDEIAVLCEGTRLAGFSRALLAKHPAALDIVQFDAFRDVASVAANENICLRLDPSDGLGSPTSGRCGLIAFPRFVPGADVSIKALSAVEAASLLVQCNLNARNLVDGGFGALAALARNVPAVTVEFSDFEQLKGTVDVFARLLLRSNLDAEAGRWFLSALAPPSIQQPVQAASALPVPLFPIPEASPRKPSSKLTIGMATYDDYDGVYFTLQSIRLFHPEILDKTQFVVLDTHPDGPCARGLKDLEHHIPNYRYIPSANATGTASRSLIFDEADSEIVLCMDCHVLVAPGSLNKMIEFFDQNPDCRDLIQGPLLFDDIKDIATHFHPEWRGGMYGYWQKDSRALDPASAPIDIPMQGLGLFACRKAAWPGFNPMFRGFGGEEGYIHEKFRQAGGRTLLLPFLRWVHRFNRPMGVPYRNTWDDRIRNYMIGFAELGIPAEEMKIHFRELLGAETANAIFAGVEDEIRRADIPTAAGSNSVSRSVA